VSCNCKSKATNTIHCSKNSVGVRFFIPVFNDKTLIYFFILPDFCDAFWLQTRFFFAFWDFFSNGELRQKVTSSAALRIGEARQGKVK